MTPDELRATARLGGQAFTGVATRVEGVHRAVAGRVFGATGPAGRPPEAVHGAIAGTVYAGLRVAGSVVGAAAGEVLLRVVPTSGQMGRTRLGNQALAALNGFVGDLLARRGDALAIRTAVRVAGHDVPVAPRDLATAFPGATAKLAVFVHGLAETETSWTTRATGGREPGYGPRLRGELGYTPVYIRYNSGRHVSANGRLLGELLTELVAGWPVPPEELVLVGHSMGGLVVRSACHYGASDGQPWVPLVRHAVYLGTPHLGAPLARAAGLTGWALSRLPETRPLAPLLNGSSDGVKDLRFGYLVDADWWGCDPDRCRRDHRTDVLLLESANHYAFGVTVTRDPDSPVGKLVGDLLVQPGSAHGQRRRRQHIAFSVDGRRRLGGLHHLDLLGHPAVWAEIRRLLRPTAAPPPTAPETGELLGR